MTYSDIVMEHFYNPRNARRMENPDAIGKAGEPGRGPFMLLYLRFDREKIVDASFQSYGCGPAIAAGSILTEKIAGLARSQASLWDSAAIDAALGYLPNEKKHCAALAASALADALTKKESIRAS